MTTLPPHTCMQHPPTVIAAGAHLKGELILQGDVRIEGVFEGRLVTKGRIEVAPGATCRASITALDVIIEGEAQGDVTAECRVHLGARASLTGEVVATHFELTSGAAFLGHCRIGPDAATGDRVPRTATPPTRPAEPTPVIRPRGIDVATRPVEVARARLAEAQAKLAQLSQTERAEAGLPAA